MKPNRKERRRFLSKFKNPNGLARRNTKGAFGGVNNRFLGEYKTLKVVPKSQRTGEINVNNCGVIV